MNAKVFMKALLDASSEFNAISQEIASQLQELESAERELRGQSEFQGHIQALRKAAEEMQEERYKVRVLSQTAENIRDLYQQTEVAVEDNFDSAMDRRMSPAGKVSLTHLNQRLNQILYRG